MESWAKECVTILSGGGFVALIGFAKWLIEKQLAARELNFKRGLERITEVYAQLNRILVETGANRVCVLRAENSGKVPAAGKDLFSSVIHEVHDEVLGPIYGKWRSQPVDAGYLKILLAVAQKSTAVIDTETIESQPLRSLFDAEGVKRSILYELFSVPTQFFYVQASFSDTKDLTKREVGIIAEALTSIRLVFMEQHKTGLKK